MQNNSSSSSQNSPSPKEGTNVTGVVIEALPNTLFRVQTSEGKELLAHLSGKMRIHRIRVLVGDKIELFVDAYGSKGRITKRL